LNQQSNPDIDAIERSLGVAEGQEGSIGRAQDIAVRSGSLGDHVSQAHSGFSQGGVTASNPGDRQSALN